MESLLAIFSKPIYNLLRISDRQKARGGKWGVYGRRSAEGAGWKADGGGRGGGVF